MVDIPQYVVKVKSGTTMCGGRREGGREGGRKRERGREKGREGGCYLWIEREFVGLFLVLKNTCYKSGELCG